MTHTQLVERINDRTMHVAVLGLGYVGLSLATTIAQAGFIVTGIDIDQERIDQVQQGQSYICDVPSSDVASLIEHHMISFTSYFETLQQCDTVIICVPTPLNKTHDPDITFLLAAAQAIQQHLHPGQLILLESTTYPGTTQEILVPVFESSGLKVGTDIFVAFSPERIDPGNHYQYKNIPKVVGGVTALCTNIAQLFYQTFIKQIVCVSSPNVAEMTKILENTFRDVNIALANEMACICNVLNVDVWEVINAASTKPFGFMPFYPGPGIGGHCIPIDPQYLAWKLRQHKYIPRFIDLATQINTSMPLYVINKVVEALNKQKQSLNGSVILLLGVAYKRNINDIRESPALDILQLLLSWNAQVIYNDNYVPTLTLGTYQLQSQPLSEKLLQLADCVLCITDHSYYDPAWIVQFSRSIVDTRNMTRGFVDTKIVKL